MEAREGGEVPASKLPKREKGNHRKKRKRGTIWEKEKKIESEEKNLE